MTTFTGRFAQLFERIAAEANDRELHRRSPAPVIDALREAGFGALRVPTELGGAGVDLGALTAEYLQLAAADSNVAHALRGHFAQVEIVLARPDSEHRTAWLRKVARGAIFGNATSELAGTTLADLDATVHEADDGTWRLNGRKFYSTGTLYATHVLVSAARDNGAERERVTLLVPTDAPGISIVDDWDGIGQRLTASGTTLFDDVVVDPVEILPYAGGPSLGPAFFQFLLVAAVAGIGAAVARDGAAYLRERTRSFITANAATPREDPQLQAVLGGLSAGAFSVAANVHAAAGFLDRALDELSHLDEGDVHARLAAVDAAEIAVYQAQVEVLPRVLTAATELFELGGASAAVRTAALDRHWRNARTIASHNPLVYKHRQIGEWALDGTSPNLEWKKLWVAHAPQSLLPVQ